MESASRTATGRKTVTSYFHAAKQGLLTTSEIARDAFFNPWARCSERLAHATNAQRLHAELSPGGYGIHWLDLDEDLSVGGLLRRSESTADRR